MKDKAVRSVVTWVSIGLAGSTPETCFSFVCLRTITSIVLCTWSSGVLTARELDPEHIQHGLVAVRTHLRVLSSKAWHDFSGQWGLFWPRLAQ